MSVGIYRFGPFRLDLAARELRRDDVAVPLPASAFDCLVYLLEHRERPVGRDELIAAVWGRGDVSETLLGHTIVRLRRALGDTSAEQHTIRTVARVGYRWVADVVPEATPVLEAAGTDEAAAMEPPAAAIAVPADAPTPAPATAAQRTRHRATALLLPAISVAILAALVLLWNVLGRDRSDRVPPAKAVVAVLPAQVIAGSDWHWLRLGLMDPIAQRLGCAHVTTLPSGAVIALLKASSTLPDDAVLWNRQLHLSFSVQPTATFKDGSWQVTLIVRNAKGEVARAGATDSDVLSAAVRAADALAGRIGCGVTHG